MSVYASLPGGAVGYISAVSIAALVENSSERAGAGALIAPTGPTPEDIIDEGSADCCYNS